MADDRHARSDRPTEGTACGEFGMVVRGDGTIAEIGEAGRSMLGLAGEAPLPRLDQLVREPPDAVAAFLLRCRIGREPVQSVLSPSEGPPSLVATGVRLVADEVLLYCRPPEAAPGPGSRIQERLLALADDVEARGRAAAEARIETEARSRVLAAASHDLRQPLHAMTLFTRALSRRVDGGEAVELVQQIGVALGSLQRMFDSLLDISRLDGGLVEVRRREVSLAEVIEPIAIELEARAAGLGLAGRARMRAVTARTDRALLERIVRNLVSNALKFTKQGGVLLAIRHTGGRIAIDVIDTGMGIEPERIEVAFQEFERGRMDARGANDGLGLGLAIVRRLSRMLDIDVVVDSRPGRGTRFRLLLPPDGDAGVAEAGFPGRARSHGATDLAGRTVLVLDDEPLAAASLLQELRDRGAQAVGAASGAEFAAITRQRSFDAAVVDFDLRGEWGTDVVERLRSRTGTTMPVLFVTGSTEEQALRRLQGSGHPWIAKPVDPDVLIALLAGMLPRG